MSLTVTTPGGSDTLTRTGFVQVSPITGGSCTSGATGMTALRVGWLDDGGSLRVSYEVKGMPDNSHFTVGAFGYSPGFTPVFVDAYLSSGGLLLDSSDYVDIQLSTAGISSITHATLSIFGRSYNTTHDGSFTWQTYAGSGSTPTDSVSNAVPYAWYSADLTSGIVPGETSALIRIKSGPSSDSLVVSKIELCLQAQ